MGRVPEVMTKLSAGDHGEWDGTLQLELFSAKNFNPTTKVSTSNLTCADVGMNHVGRFCLHPLNLRSTESPRSRLAN